MIPQPTSPEYHTACNLYMAAKGTEDIPTVDELIGWINSWWRASGAWRWATAAHQHNYCIIRIAATNTPVTLI